MIYKRIILLILSLSLPFSFGAPRYMVSWDNQPEDEYSPLFQGYGFFESDIPNAESLLEQNSPDYLVENLWSYKTYVWLGNQTMYIFEPDDTKPTYRTIAAYYGVLGWSPGTRETKLTPYRQPTISPSLFREEGTGILKLLLTITDDPKIGIQIKKSTDMINWTTLEELYMGFEEIEYRVLPLSGPAMFFKAGRISFEEVEIIIPAFPWPSPPIDPSLPQPEEPVIINDSPAIIPDPPVRKPVRPHQTIPEREKKRPAREFIPRIHKQPIRVHSPKVP